MDLFDCPCGYRWIIGKKKVFGPIWAEGENTPSYLGRMHSREEWEDNYDDCKRSLDRASNPYDTIKKVTFTDELFPYPEVNPFSGYEHYLASLTYKKVDAMPSLTLPRSMGDYLCITFRDFGGEEVARLLKLTDDGYYGGCTHPSIPSVFMGPHYWLSGENLLSKIAKMATDEIPAQITIHSYRTGLCNSPVRISRNINLRELSNALDMTPERVREYFANTIRITS